MKSDIICCYVFLCMHNIYQNEDVMAETAVVTIHVAKLGSQRLCRFY